MDFNKYFPSLPAIETKRLLLRQITSSESDGSDSLEFINDYSVYRYWGVFDEYRKEDENNRRPQKQIFLDYHYKETMKEYKAGNELSWLMESKENHKVIGEIVLYDFMLDLQADVGYRLNKDYWGYGYATEAGQAITSFAFESLGLERLQIRCFKNNPGSVRQ